MTNSELELLYKSATARIDQLATKYRSGERLTRWDCLELRACNNRLYVVAYQLWLQLGQPDDPAFDCLRRPPPRRALPFSNTREMTGGGH